MLPEWIWRVGLAEVGDHLACLLLWDTPGDRSHFVRLHGRGLFVWL